MLYLNYNNLFVNTDVSVKVGCFKDELAVHFCSLHYIALR